MGNQQAAFYYSLNYEDSNDSGYFDDDIFSDKSYPAPLDENETSHETSMSPKIVPQTTNNDSNHTDNDDQEPITYTNLPRKNSIRPLVKSKSIDINRRPMTTNGMSATFNHSIEPNYGSLDSDVFDDMEDNPFEPSRPQLSNDRKNLPIISVINIRDFRFNKQEKKQQKYEFFLNNRLKPCI